MYHNLSFICANSSPEPKGSGSSWHYALNPKIKKYIITSIKSNFEEEYGHIDKDEIETLYMLRKLDIEIQTQIIKSIKQSFEEKRGKEKLSYSKEKNNSGIA